MRGAVSAAALRLVLPFLGSILVASALIVAWTTPSVQAGRETWAQASCGSSSNTSNFNGTDIPAQSYIWFQSRLTAGNLPADGQTIAVTNASITFTAASTQYVVPVPDATITGSATATTATTTFVNGTWVTVVPGGAGGSQFVSGVAVPVPNGLPGGINPVTWTATFNSNPPDNKINWQWSAAVYTTFTTDYNALGVDTQVCRPTIRSTSLAGRVEVADPTTPGRTAVRSRHVLRPLARLRSTRQRLT